MLQEVFYVGGTENLLFEAFFHGLTENFRAMTLQDVVKPINVVVPLPGAAMNDLREVQESGLPQFQELLAF